MIFKALLDEGDEVIVPSPYFMEFKFYIDNNGGEIRLVETNDDFSLNLEEIEKAIGEKTKASPDQFSRIIRPASFTARNPLKKLGQLLKRKSRELGRRSTSFRMRPIDGSSTTESNSPISFTILSPHHPGDLPFQGSVPPRGKDRLCRSQPSLRRGGRVDLGPRLCQPDPRFCQCPGPDAEAGRPPSEKFGPCSGIRRKKGPLLQRPDLFRLSGGQTPGRLLSLSKAPNRRMTSPLSRNSSRNGS